MKSNVLEIVDLLCGCIMFVRQFYDFFVKLIIIICYKKLIIICYIRHFLHYTKLKYEAKNVS